MEQALLNVAQIFTQEINKLNARREGSAVSITLTIAGPGRWDNEKTVKVNLSCSFYDGDNHQTVKGASLGVLMDEVYRRAGFTDREAVRNDAIEASLKALPAPDENI